MESFCLDIGAADVIGWRCVGFFDERDTAYFCFWYNDGFGLRLLPVQGHIHEDQFTLLDDKGSQLLASKFEPPMPSELLRKLGTRIRALRPTVAVEAADG